VYNNKVVLNGGLQGKFQVGTKSGQTIDFTIASIDTDTLKLTDLDSNSGVTYSATNGYAIETSGITNTTSSAGSAATGTAGAISILTAQDASDNLAAISTAIETVAENRATYGALQNRLEYTVSNLMNVAEFTTSARSRIEDADFAAESARLAKAQVLQQVGTAMLAQANAAPQLALQLIR
jgi:flagellin